MKKKVFIVVCMTLTLMLLTACSLRQMRSEPVTVAPAATSVAVPTAAPTSAPLVTPAPSLTIVTTPTPAPTSAPTPVTTPTPILVSTPAPTVVQTPAPTPVTAASNLPRVTKSPIGETVAVNGTCQFVARYENAKWAEWHFVSPDGSRDLDYIQAQREFTTMKILHGDTKDLTLENIPEAINNWKVYCRFSNDYGSVKTDSALIIVRGVSSGSATPAGGTVVPTSANLPRITKDPTGETVAVNGKCQFVTRYENAKWAEWHFVSPNGSRDLSYKDAQKEFTTLKILHGDTKDLTLESIPEALNGWKVYCRFSNDYGSVNSGSALITVRGAASGSVTPAGSTVTPASVNLPRITKDPTGETVAVNGKCQFVTRYENAKWAEWHFVSPNGSRDLNYKEAQKEFSTMKILHGDTKDLTLESIPEALNGWKVYCRFSNDYGSVNSSSAKITVTGTGGGTVPAASRQGFEGRWAEEVAGRCQMTFSYRGEGSMNVDISWSNSAWERSRWQMTADVYRNDIMVYSDGHSWVESYTDGNVYVVSQESFGGTGSFFLQNGKLHWINDQTNQETVLIPA